MKSVQTIMLCLLCCLIGCAPSGESKSKDTFTVYQMNLWMAGANVPGELKNVVDVLEEVNADVVFLCEIYGNKTVSKVVEDLKARGLDYYYEAYDLNVGILSKIKPDSTVACCTVPGNEIRTLLKAVITIDGQPISFFSAHLDHMNYACYLPRGYNGNTWAKGDGIVTDEKEVLEANRLAYRDESIRAFLNYVQDDLKQGRPIILGGDFNEPSHLDWQADTKNLRDHNGAIIHWDCSMLLGEAGFKDSYREIYPDPVRNPGVTYPAGNRAAKEANIVPLTYAPDADERDRIDYIYYHPGKNRLKLKTTTLVGPAETVSHDEIVANDAEDRFFTPSCIWPTDHKANLATFQIK